MILWTNGTDEWYLVTSFILCRVTMLVAMVTKEQVIHCAAIVVECHGCGGLDESIAEQDRGDEEEEGGTAVFPVLHGRVYGDWIIHFTRVVATTGMRNLMNL